MSIFSSLSMSLQVVYGTTYVYESTDYWVKEKQQSRSKRVCIGKLDDEGQLVPSKRLTDPSLVLPVKRDPVPATEAKHHFYGAVYLFDALGDKLKVTEDLQHCFPDTYKQILSIAYYLILEDRNALSRFPKWEKTHRHPYGKNISSLRSKDYGFFALISSEIKDPIKALETYRIKALVEKAFGNLKERLNMRRTTVSSDSALEGKLFVQFIALIYLSYIKKQMSDQGLYKTYTMQQLLDELDVIECFEQPGCAMRIGEITKKQEALYHKLDVVPPASL